MSESKITAGRDGKPIRTAEAIKLMKEYDLMLEEIEMMLTTELITIHLVREKKQYDPIMISEMAVRLLELKKNRTMCEDAVLAYARKKLFEEGKKCKLHNSNFKMQN
jgi:hypothetical protein